jgi:hypothetical protein
VDRRRTQRRTANDGEAAQDIYQGNAKVDSAAGNEKLDRRRKGAQEKKKEKKKENSVTGRGRK